jgi:hypothetical protein
LAIFLFFAVWWWIDYNSWNTCWSRPYRLWLAAPFTLEHGDAWYSEPDDMQLCIPLLPISVNPLAINWEIYSLAID